MYRKKQIKKEELSHSLAKGLHYRSRIKESVSWELVNKHKVIKDGWYKDVILEFRYARTRQKLTQAELGKLIGSHQPWISAFENGRVNPSFEFLARIAKALGKKIVLHLE